jgi:hypothetical protein
MQRASLPFRKTYIPSAARFAGAATAKAEQKKDLYSNLLNQYLFSPFAVETRFHFW